MTSLKVGYVQEASTLDPAENRELLRRHVGKLVAENPDVVVFPEVFARDFGKSGSDISEFAETLEGPFVEELTGLAAEHDVTIIAGMFERSADPARPYNTLVVADPGSVRSTYRKIHLYDSFGYKESDRLLAGPLEPVIVRIRGVDVGLMTCYDLRFPELARALVDDGAQVLVVPAAWVAGPGKVQHWRTLATARAIENTAYVVAVGQPGPRYTGHSLAIGPLGEILAESDDAAMSATVTLDLDALVEARSENPSLANRRF